MPANTSKLQKVIKLTQNQYDTLSNGGTVGDFTGLDDNYLYLIQDNNTYITSDGGTIDGGDIHFYNGHGIAELDDNENVIAGFYAGMFGDEIIYNDSTKYRTLFANESYELIYSENSDYLTDFTFGTSTLKISDDSDTGASMTFDVQTAAISHNNSGTSYSATLPSASGTLALESYVQANPATTTATLTGIKIGNTSYAIPSGSSTDVQINGTSITSNNVANILTNSSYSSSNKIATMSDIPSTYLKTASTSGNTLTLTKQDNTTVTYTPSFNEVPTTTTANKLLVSTSTSGTEKWSDWSSAGFLKTNTSGVVSVDTNTYLTTTGKAADADKLDGNDSTYYLNYNNLTNKPTIPSVSLTTTAGSESITVDSSSLNVVTRDTEQTITTKKTFVSANGRQTMTVGTTGNSMSLDLETTNASSIKTGESTRSPTALAFNQYSTSGSGVRTGRTVINPIGLQVYENNASATLDVNSYTNYSHGQIRKRIDSSHDYTYTLPDDSGTLALTSNIPQVKRFI